MVSLHLEIVHGPSIDSYYLLNNGFSSTKMLFTNIRKKWYYDGVTSATFPKGGMDASSVRQHLHWVCGTITGGYTAMQYIC